MSKLEQVVVENTPLISPKLVTAERGIEAIREYFKAIEGDMPNEEYND